MDDFGWKTLSLSQELFLIFFRERFQPNVWLWRWRSSGKMQAFSGALVLLLLDFEMKIISKVPLTLHYISKLVFVYPDMPWQFNHAFSTTLLCLSLWSVQAELNVEWLHSGQVASPSQTECRYRDTHNYMLTQCRENPGTHKKNIHPLHRKTLYLGFSQLFKYSIFFRASKYLFINELKLLLLIPSRYVLCILPIQLLLIFLPVRILLNFCCVSQSFWFTPFNSPAPTAKKLFVFSIDFPLRLGLHFFSLFYSHSPHPTSNSSFLWHIHALS